MADALCKLDRWRLHLIAAQVPRLQAVAELQVQRNGRLRYYGTHRHTVVHVHVYADAARAKLKLSSPRGTALAGALTCWPVLLAQCTGVPSAMAAEQAKITRVRRAAVS